MLSLPLVLWKAGQSLTLRRAHRVSCVLKAGRNDVSAEGEEKGKPMVQKRHRSKDREGGLI